MTDLAARAPLVLVLALYALLACGDTGPDRWPGSVDTLASGRVVVENPATPLWPPDSAWTLTEELRIGTLDAEGPELFGQVRSLAVDDGGRIYVLEGQAQEVRVFDRDGRHVRTFGREGGGPGEFARALQIERGPHGNLWVVDPENNRVSVFDTTGAYLRGHGMPGGFVLIPWPGGFDRHGRYYYPVPLRSDEEFRIGLARHDSTLQVLDTLAVPTDPVEREYFELRSEHGFARASIPFDGSFRWWLSPEGTLWGLLTDRYRLFELSPAGDTLRTVTRAFDPLPVTDADLDEAREDLAWFLEEGGEVDWAKIPSEKPAVESMTFDDEGNLWVWPVTDRDEENRRLDVFDPTGRFLGRVASPVPIAPRPHPVIRQGAIYAVTESELEVPYVVRLRIHRPGGAAGGDRAAGR